jgi:type I restriction enzyme, S subunit
LLVQRVARIRPTGGADNDYLRHALGSQAFRDYFAPITTGVSVPHISEEQIMAFRLAAYSNQRQRAVAAALNREVRRVAEIRGVLSAQASLLVERRQALVTAAVTGEIQGPVAI